MASASSKPKSSKSSWPSPRLIAPAFTPLYMSVLVRSRSAAVRSGCSALTFIWINSSTLAAGIPRAVSSRLTSSSSIQPFENLAMRSGKATYTLVHKT
ncbi:hypothetical protein ES705_44111 [subsurface metagenome]